MSDRRKKKALWGVAICTWAILAAAVVGGLSLKQPALSGLVVGLATYVIVRLSFVVSDHIIQS